MPSPSPLDSMSRRNVLKTGAAVTAGGLVGLTGSAAARGPVNGGMAMIASSVLQDYGPGDPFKVVERFPRSNPWAPTMIDAACDEETEMVSFWPYKMLDENDEHLRYLFFPEGKRVTLGEALRVFHNVEEHCSDVGDGRHWVKVRVKPARGGGRF